MKTSNMIGLGVLMASAALACSKTPERHPETQASAMSAGMTPAARTRSAAEQIAESRCVREQQCGNIGANKSYSTKQDCLLRVQADWKDDLNARQCPGGINQVQLDECLSEVRGEACENPFDTLARVAECTSAQICIEQP